ncbi:hypothetical protein [Aquimarina sp. MMG016]|nr:hypothetical protein [Aquimarina sp. MMG016]
MLLEDIKKDEDDNTPVYSISMNGTLVFKSFTKIANVIFRIKT